MREERGRGKANLRRKRKSKLIVKFMKTWIGVLRHNTDEIAVIPLIFF